MGTKETQTSLKTLGNAAELVCGIVQEIVGNDIADSINGSPLTRESIYQLTHSQFGAQFAKLTS